MGLVDSANSLIINGLMVSIRKKKGSSSTVESTLCGDCGAWEVGVLTFCKNPLYSRIKTLVHLGVDKITAINRVRKIRELRFLSPSQMEEDLKALDFVLALAEKNGQ